MTSYAVILKAFSWDGFIERQAERCRKAAPGGDFFVSLDETARKVGAIPAEDVFRFDRRDLASAGLAWRYEEGSLLWWNTDYAHYTFFRRHPKYDYYVFIEYDAVIMGSIDALVEKVAARDLDLVVQPIKKFNSRWRWALLHRQTYGMGEMRGSLVCISIVSRRAMVLLGQRRSEMSNSRVPFWPSSEVFMPTESARAGLKVAPLSDFGDVAHYDAFPPMLERLLPRERRTEIAFVHPVLDDERYVASLLRSTRFIDFLRGEKLRNALALAVSPPSSMQVVRAGLGRFRDAVLVRRRLAAVRLFAKLACDGAATASPSSNERAAGS